MKDDMGLIADTAIIALGVKAKRIEEIAFQLAGTPEGSRLISIVEDMRDAEETLRQRIRAIARSR